MSLFFFFNDTATTEIYTLSLHDALPIYACALVPVVEAGLPVARLTLSPATPRRSPLAQRALDLLSAMEQFRCPHYFAASIIDERDAGGFAPRIELDAQRLKMRLLHGTLENQREWIPAIDRRLALFQEQAGMPRMHRVQGLFSGI